MIFGYSLACLAFLLSFTFSFCCFTIVGSEVAIATNAFLQDLTTSQLILLLSTFIILSSNVLITPFTVKTTFIIYLLALLLAYFHFYEHCYWQDLFYFVVFVCSNLFYAIIHKLF